MNKSKRERKKNANHSAKPQEPNPQPAEKPDKWTLGDYVGLFGGLTGIVSVVVAVFAGCEARKSREVAEEAQKTNQQTYERMSGQLGAKLRTDQFHPTWEEIPQEFKLNKPEGVETVRIDSWEYLKSLNPHVVVTNIGKEPIEAVRIESKAVLIGFSDPERGNDKWGVIKSWALKRPELDDIPLPKKLMPGKSMKIPLVTGLVAQMIKNTGSGYRDRLHYGVMEVRCFSKLVGASSFDEGEGNPMIPIKVAWIPNNFTDDKCKELFQGSKPTVEMLDTKP